ncbi:esterase-like activity of phytase family protein [Hyphomicrobium sp. LHD-15]|uniref:esterase-like activity of phytase family protein n=1 Tax=Hyphomicrobium sp. LHD-15 TaxID=3072142 RepID=UPI00281096C1|nr:esterase-like activity of phytase family protein [Hyphomicrobium sp. LHD-15]MDQ8698156.1 esterase-like activity of phytase family protein [Hyphomicrobium sp. LHD-15]
MFENIAAALASLCRSALAVLVSTTAADSRWDIPSAQGAILEIEPGDGPAWGTLSGLTAHPTDPQRLYAVTDQDSRPIRIVEIQLSPDSVKVVRQINVNGRGDDAIDPEGIVAKQDGGFWLASEGSAGNAPPNRLIEVDSAGQILRSISLPASLAPRMGRKGIEGVTLERTADNGHLVVVFQAPLVGDPPEYTRIGVVDAANETWRFSFYPLDRTGSGELTGLSEVLHLRDRTFAAIERDGKGGKRSIKWITTFELAPEAGAAPDETPPLLVKRRALDLVQLFISSGRKVEKEVEGLALAVDGNIYAVTDNDNERATLLLRFGSVDQLF